MGTDKDTVKSIGMSDLALFLAGAETVFYDCVMRNMSERAAAMLEAKMKSLVDSGISKTDTNAAKEKILIIANALREKGEI